MVDPDVLAWFKSQLEEGFTKGQLVDTMRESGYSEVMIDEMLNALKVKESAKRANAGMSSQKLWDSPQWHHPKPSQQQPQQPSSQPVLKQEPVKKQGSKLSIKTVLMVVSVLVLLAGVAFVCVFFVLPMLGQESSCRELKSGSNYITESTVLCKGKHTGATVYVSKDSVILDCNNSILEGGTELTGLIISSVSNVHIKNCQLMDYSTAVYIIESDDIILENLEISHPKNDKILQKARLKTLR
ncbi:right-handed parallel beta-helix repeat-containing protein [archaeon]|nr:right-handed parallel beta-helix repeat-containing protein [archaeon]